MKPIFVLMILLISLPMLSQVSQKENAEKAVEAVKHIFPQWKQLQFEFDKVDESAIPDYLQARFYVTHQDKKVPVVVYYRKDMKYVFVGQFIDMENNNSLTNEFAGEIKFTTVDMNTLNLKNAARIGELNAPVTIIEYSDFQCPYCKKAAPTVKKILENYKDKIVFIYKHIPWPKHKFSRKLEIAAECAREQDEQAFWNFHDIFFSEDFKIEDEKELQQKVMDIASKNKLNKTMFKSCYENNKTEALINEHFNESKVFKVSSTPTFVINGQRLLGALPYENFSNVINEKLNELQKTK